MKTFILNFNKTEFVRYILVGSFVATIYFLIYFFMVYFLNIQHITSNIVSFLITFPMSFWGHRNYTFNVKTNFLSHLIFFTITLISIFIFNQIILDNYGSLINENVLVFFSLFIIVFVRFMLYKIIFKIK